MIRFLKWFVGVFLIGVVTSVVASILFELQWPKFLDPMPEYSRSLRTWLQQDVAITRWWYGVLLVALLGTGLQLVLILFHFLLRPSYFRYTQDVFYDLVWKWRWDLSGSLDELWCYCPNCDRQLVYDTQVDPKDNETKTAFMCQACKVPFIRLGDLDDTLIGVKHEVEWKLRTNAWKRSGLHPRP